MMRVMFWAALAILSTGFSLSHAAHAGDRHANYYYPPPQRVEIYAARAEVFAHANPVRRIGPRATGVAFAFLRSEMKTLRNRRVPIVMLSLDDPGIWRAWNSHARGCIARYNDCTVYVTPDREVKGLASRKVRTVLWTSPAPVKGVVSALSHAMRRKQYSPRRDADAW